MIVRECAAIRAASVSERGGADRSLTLAALKNSAAESRTAI